MTRLNKPEAVSTTRETAFAASIARDIIQCAATYDGVDPAELCRRAGLTLEDLHEPERRIPGHIMRTLWSSAVAMTGDEHFGLHTAERFRMAAISLVGYVLMNCRTLGEALDRLARYTNLFSEGLRYRISRDGALVHIDLDIVRDRENYLLDSPRHPIEGSLASTLRGLASLSGRPVDPVAVWFQHEAPGDLSEHRRILRAPVHFNMPANRLTVPADVLTVPIASADARLLQLFEGHAEQALQALDSVGMLARAGEACARLLNGKAPTLDQVARELGVSGRALQRHLQAEGTSWRAVLDKTRYSLALRYLKQPQISIADIAFLLGFSEPSAFHRAFKHWTGQTPQQFRTTGGESR